MCILSQGVVDLVFLAALCRFIVQTVVFQCGVLPDRVWVLGARCIVFCMCVGEKLVVF